MRLLLGSLVAELNGIDFSLDDEETKLARFVTEKAADFVIDATVGDVPPSEWGPIQYFPPEVDGARRRVRFGRTGCSAVVDLERRHVSMELIGPWPLQLDVLLVNVTQVMAPELRRGVVFHASSAVGEGLAAVFAGHSGAGKTTAGTLARLAGAELISEELTYVALESDGARLCALPFHQKFKLAAPDPGTYPLRAFYAIQQDERDEIEALPRNEWVRQLLAYAVVALRERVFAVPVLEVCEALAERVPVRRLHFRKTPAFWQVVTDDLGATGAS